MLFTWYDSISLCGRKEKKGRESTKKLSINIMNNNK